MMICPLWLRNFTYLNAAKLLVFSIYSKNQFWALIFENYADDKDIPFFFYGPTHLLY